MIRSLSVEVVVVVVVVEVEVMGVEEVEGFEIEPPGDLGGGRRLLNIPPFHLPFLFVWVISLSEVSGRKEREVLFSSCYIFLLLYILL